ncbi:peptidyl-prolyl cis-trans isomerase D [Maridesulfovibrio ferrireducens]|uniref:Periplasmic chaperone PpiD n=1 Tax=Maridesulfovibrio ferrireducens TaxID=246191 RepID=A0A1G9BJ34_9BACT|nr:SurA N-terminal domain-containing protein [Maridesulfovibrio ferrireducens]SDK39496.1 peptidyl-prolyl cis-trans isomerase D [Maridesulfovibrio ferrireducens]
MLDIMRQNAQGWGIKVLFGIIILVFIFAFGMSGFDGNTDPVIAYVNDEPIPTQEFVKIYRQTAEILREQDPTIDPDQLQSPEFKKAILNQLINSKILEAEARRLGISISNSELYYEISKIPAFATAEGKFDKARYQGYLQGRQMSASTFENDMRSSNLIQKIQEYVAIPAVPTEAQARALFDWAGERAQIDYYYVSGADFLDKAKIEDAAIEAYYKANPNSFTVPTRSIIEYISFTPEELSVYEDVSPEELSSYYAANKDQYEQDEQVKARHILLLVDENASAADIKKAENKIQKILAKAKSGEDFAKLAKKYSEGPSKTKGGELGWFSRGAMVKPFEDAAFKLKKGQISEPVRTRFGFHIIKVDDTRESGQKAFDQVETEIKNTIAQEKAADSISTKLDHAIDLLASGMKLDAVGEELGVAIQKSEKATLENLTRAFGMTEDAAQTIIALPKGSSTEMPIAVDNGYLIAQKVEEIPASLNPLEEVKKDINDFLAQQQAMQMAKIKATVIMGKLSTPATAEQGLKSIKKDLKTSEPFGRDGFIPGLGMNPKLAETAFASTKNTWLPQAFELPGGYIVARLDERIPPSEETWESQKQAILTSLERQQANEMINSFMTELRSKAKVEVVRPDILNN